MRNNRSLEQGKDPIDPHINGSFILRKVQMQSSGERKIVLWNSCMPLLYKCDTKRVMQKIWTLIVTSQNENIHWT